MSIVLHIPLSAAEQPPGPAALQALDDQIAATRIALSRASSALQSHQHHGMDLVEERATALIGTLDQQRPPTTTTGYLALVEAHTGLHPLKPMPAWHRSWVAHRMVEHRLHDRWRAVQSSLQELVLLRQRLATQLGNPRP